MLVTADVRIGSACVILELITTDAVVVVVAETVLSDGFVLDVIELENVGVLVAVGNFVEVEI